MIKRDADAMVSVASSIENHFKEIRPSGAKLLAPVALLFVESPVEFEVCPINAESLLALVVELASTQAIPPATCA